LGSQQPQWIYLEAEIKTDVAEIGWQK
jgi:hypothetical protein